MQGRDFSRFDIAPAAPYVGVINETFAKLAFPNKNPIGKKIVCNGDQVCDVIGVRGQMVLHVRFKGDADWVIPQLRRYIAGLDPNMPAFEIRTLAAEVDAVLVRDRLLALL